MEWPQSLASVGACHLHTDVSVTTGPHSIQDTAQQGISGRDREGEEGRGGGGSRGEGEEGVRCVYLANEQILHILSLFQKDTPKTRTPL